MTAPGWYPDPTGTPQHRYWDGASWTQYFTQPSTPPALGTQCPRCGIHAVQKLRGLHGAKEALTGVLLGLVFLLPGIVYYAIAESIPYCTSCNRRIRRSFYR